MNRRITTVAAILMIAAASLFAATPIDVELVDGYGISYLLEPSDSIISFLQENGVDTELLASNSTNTFDAQLAALYRIEAAEDEDSLKRQLVDKITAALFNEHDGENVVYMELGNYRWIVSPYVEDE